MNIAFSEFRGMCIFFRPKGSFFFIFLIRERRIFNLLVVSHGNWDCLNLLGIVVYIYWVDRKAH